jgi:hypothetical protein
MHFNGQSSEHISAGRSLMMMFCPFAIFADDVNCILTFPNGEIVIHWLSVHSRPSSSPSFPSRLTRGTNPLSFRDCLFSCTQPRLNFILTFRIFFQITKEICIAKNSCCCILSQQSLIPPVPVRLVLVFLRSFLRLHTPFSLVSTWTTFRF